MTDVIKDPIHWVAVKEANLFIIINKFPGLEHIYISIEKIQSYCNWVKTDFVSELFWMKLQNRSSI